MGDGLPHLYVVVPVLNERPNLPTLFEGFRCLQAEMSSRFQISFMVVDDGSTDGTADAARESAEGLEVAVLRHGTNLGPGRAFATAFRQLSTRLSSDDWVATMEGDNTSRQELLAQMLVRAQEGYEVVLASPYMYGGGITNTSSLREILSHVANGFVKEFLGCHGLLTVSSFFRLYRGSAMRSLMDRYGPGVIERAGFESMVEVIIKLVHLGISISEVPMILDSSRRVGKSKMRIMRTGLGYLALFRGRRRWCRG
jgi:dolichol-phosphate mannosyltransferase